MQGTEPKAYRIVNTFLLTLLLFRFCTLSYTQTTEQAVRTGTKSLLSYQALSALSWVFIGPTQFTGTKTNGGNNRSSGYSRDWKEKLTTTHSRTRRRECEWAQHIQEFSLGRGRHSNLPPYYLHYSFDQNRLRSWIAFTSSLFDCSSEKHMARKQRRHLVNSDTLFFIRVVVFTYSQEQE